MELWTIAVLTEGARKVLNRNGRVLVGTYLVAFLPVVLGLDVLVGGWLADALEAVAGVDADPTAAIGMPNWLAGLTVFLGLLGVAVLSIGALRTFLGRSTAGLAWALFLTGMPAVAVQFLTGAVLFTAVWMVGLVAFVIPGVVAWALLIYWTVAVVEEEATVPEAMRRSLDLTAGHRVGVVLLYLAYWTLVALALAAVAGAYVVDPLLGLALLAVAAAVLTVYLLAITSVSYVHLWADTMDVEPSVEGFDEFTPASEALEDG